MVINDSSYSSTWQGWHEACAPPGAAIRHSAFCACARSGGSAAARRAEECFVRRYIGICRWRRRLEGYTPTDGYTPKTTRRLPKLGFPRGCSGASRSCSPRGSRACAVHGPCESSPYNHNESSPVLVRACESGGGSQARGAGQAGAPAPDPRAHIDSRGVPRRRLRRGAHQKRSFLFSRLSS